ncbi:hypothetical protein [Kiloniella antarctica]|uniref:Solute-binding protein family 3/N-terminal domain-containing protein n=1 Tax=Kiloniella antarctica TaxID=1550907 RepID=A0ABW5BHG1_9PROT
MRKALSILVTVIINVTVMINLGLVIISAIFTNALAQVTEIIPLITYHSHVPFVTSTNHGLTYDLATYLTEKSNGRYKFQVRTMSRPRVDTLITSARTFVVPWVDPIWLNDLKETKYLWTEKTLIPGENVVISRQNNKINYDGPKSFTGLKFGGVRGHHYVEIDDFISQTENTVRIDSDRHLSNIQKLINGLIDVTVMPTSAANYFFSELDLSDSLFIATTPHSTYNRKILITNERKDIRDFLDQITLKMTEDTNWKTTIRYYKNGE